VPFASALSEHPDAATAVGEVAGRVIEQLGEAPDVALLFVTTSHETQLNQIAAAVRRIVDPAVLAGCVTGSVLGTEREVEDRPAISLWAGVTGPARGTVLRASPSGEGEASLAGWLTDDELGFGPSGVIVLADPYSFPAPAFLGFVDDDRPGLPVIGGFASSPRPTLVLDEQFVTDGAVAVFLGPDVAVETVVSQGCRPIGEPWAVTAAEGNLVRELGGRPPLERLSHLASDALSEEEIALVNRGALHVGRVIDERKATFGRGDFLVRNIVGGDRITGALAVADDIEVGTTLQFHLRDPASATDDLHTLLRGRRADSALVFTCNGRGLHTFGVADHDASVVSAELGAVPVAGMFAAGEFGPVGGRNFLHGFTASIALISDRTAPG